MTHTETFQLSLAAAEAYESRFVPALFAEWAPLIAEAAGLTTGQEVLDVACGTGVVAREAANRVRRTGRVVAVDINEAMLRPSPRHRYRLAERRRLQPSVPGLLLRRRSLPGRADVLRRPDGRSARDEPRGE